MYPQFEKYAHSTQNYTLDLKFVSVKVFKYKCKKEQYKSSSCMYKYLGK